MARLTSLLFRSIVRLQRCANEPLQHVMLKTPREKGPHVEAIQHALAMLGFDDIDVPEKLSFEYGPSTEATVWEFKKKHDIRSLGQTIPDKIVGQLTIQKMDSLLPGGALNKDPKDENVTVFEVSPRKVLKARIFWLSSAKDAGNPVPNYLVQATKLLNPHGMRASVTATVPTSFVAFDEELDGLRGRTGTMSRARAAVGAPVDVGGIVTIVGRFKRPFKSSSPAGSVEVGHTEFQDPFFDFATTIFLNSTVFSIDNVTLVHEMGHAAGADLHGFTEKDWRSQQFESNFMSHSGKGGRSEMMKWQGDALASSSFAFKE